MPVTVARNGGREGKSFNLFPLDLPPFFLFLEIHDIQYRGSFFLIRIRRRLL